jgi:hypothetical protein
LFYANRRDIQAKFAPARADLGRRNHISASMRKAGVEKLICVAIGGRSDKLVNL